MACAEAGLQYLSPHPIPLPQGAGATAFLRFCAKHPLPQGEGDGCRKENETYLTPLPQGEGATAFLRFCAKHLLPLGEGWGEGNKTGHLGTGAILCLRNSHGEVCV